MSAKTLPSMPGGPDFISSLGLREKSTLWLPAAFGGCYAANAAGNHMAPAVCDGDLVIADPDAAPQPGQLVVVWLRPGVDKEQAWLKRLVDDNASFIKVEADHPSRRWTVPRGYIIAVHPVVRILTPEQARKARQRPGSH